MLKNSPFYNGNIRKIIEVFGALFSDIHIQRYDNSGNLYQTLQIPCNYGPKEKWFTRNVQNPMPGVDDQVAAVWPRMSYEITGYQYDGTRKLTSTGRTVALGVDRTVLQAQYNPVPYNIGLELNVGATTVEDGLMIVEQILPFFVPDYTVSVNDVPSLGLTKDIIFVLNGMQQQDSWEGPLPDQRTIMWSLNFIAKAYLYPPVKSTKVILQEIINQRIDGFLNVSDLLPSIIITPFPNNATAATVTDAQIVSGPTVVVIAATPTVATILGGHNATFTISVTNASSTSFTVSVPTTSQSGNDTYSVNSGRGTFTYIAGTGARVTQETIIVTFTSTANTTRQCVVALTLDP